jgi:hypothetical protein
MYQQQDGQGDNLWYKVEAFITLKLTGYHLQSNDTYMVFEFIRWGSECLDAIS